MGASPLWRCSDSAPNCPLEHTHTHHKNVHTYTQPRCIAAHQAATNDTGNARLDGQELERKRADKEGNES